MLSGEGNQNCEIQQWVSLHAARFFVHFLDVALDDYYVKRPETSWFSRFMEEMSYMFLFTFSTTAHSL